MSRYRCLGFVSQGKPKTVSEADGLRIKVSELEGGVPGGVVGTTGPELVGSPITRGGGGGKTGALGSGVGGRGRDGHFEVVCKMYSTICTWLGVSTAGCPRGAGVKSLGLAPS